jgi:hypothetical protein
LETVIIKRVTSSQQARRFLTQPRGGIQ